MRLLLLTLTVLLLWAASAHRALAQTTPLDPAILDPAVSAALSQYSDSAGYAYAGDCQIALPLPGAVCTLVFSQEDGSLLAGLYLLGDDGTAALQPFDTLFISVTTSVAPVIPPVRLRIPRIGVDASVVTLSVRTGTNVLDTPKTKDDVGYYDFTPAPGYGGNTVLAGHVDWYTGETGVFWDLKQLAPGDTVQLVMQDGALATYVVTTTQLYANETAPIDAILGDTPTEALTLITCEGVFDPAVAEYNQRRVVRAERIYP